ncbi:thioredoxin domain-containing protein [Citricoccus sp. I39-566]|uniref:DsbA family protein n=1 Tax=Citricoccus sp. I39-566 TaxID=3073268 RepID=UPI00286B95BD|nr:thioredoxin domain-containing protein [Citricoccus sp. I39-566]WMY79470.1 thioredoxin domain-containing protein [Citricoccus sp. I39-566]
MASSNKQTKAERQQTAREKARQMQEEQRRQERRRSLMVRWGVVTAVVVVIAVVVGIIFMNSSRSIPDAGPAPSAANDQGGITLTSTTELAPGDEAFTEVDNTDASQPELTGEAPTSVPGGEARPAGEPAQIIVYADANCVHCASFEQENAGLMAEWLDAGEVTVEYRMLDYLDNPATGNYSSRAGNALACMAEQSPEHYNSFMTQIFASYATKQGEGLSDDELKEMASGLGADLNSCIDGNEYRPFVTHTGMAAREAQIAGTPSVWVQGENWDQSTPFAEYVEGKIAEQS